MDEPPSPFFPYSDLPSTGEIPSESPTDEPPSISLFFPYSRLDGTPSPTYGPPSPTDDSPPSPTDELPSLLLKSRIPRKTIIVDDSNNFFGIDNVQCPLQKGIIYYRRKGAIFEHNICSSGKHEPRIIVPKRSSWFLMGFSFVPITGNQILLFAKYSKVIPHKDCFLHLSIHEIRSDNRVGPALWSFNCSVPDAFNIFDLELINFTENPMAITFWAPFNGRTRHWKLLDISAIGTDASDKSPLLSRRVGYDLKIKELKWVGVVKLSPDKRILLNATILDRERDNETIDIHYSDCGGTNFSFVTQVSIPMPRSPQNLRDVVQNPELVFSADGSKFAIATSFGRVSVWDIRSKVPLKTFIVPKRDCVECPQFSSGKLGKEVLVFVTRTIPEIIHVIDATSFEMEETFLFPESQIFALVDVLSFDPSGGTLYAKLNGTLYEWDLQKNKHGPEWWIGEDSE